MRRRRPGRSHSEAEGLLPDAGGASASDTKAMASPSEAERSLGDLVRRARLGVALIAGAAVVTGRQTGALPDELLGRGFLLAGVLLTALVLDELPERVGRPALRAATAVGADLAASSLALTLLLERTPLAPAVLLWPLFTAGFTLSRFHVLSVGVLASVVTFGLLLSLDSSSSGLASASGWVAIYLAVAFAHSEILRQFRRAQRTTEAAFSSAAHLVPATTPGEVAETLFGLLDELLGTVGAPAVLFWDEQGEGRFAAAFVREVQLESHARLGFASPTSLVGGLSAGQGLWVETGRVADELNLVDALRVARAIFILPLSDGKRTVGFAIVASDRERRLSDEAQRGLARVAAHAASALQRLRLGQLVSRQRAAMATLLDTREARDDLGAIASWVARTARNVIGAETALLVMREPTGELTALTETGAEEVGAKYEALGLLEAAFRRDVPLLVPDAAAELRFALGSPFRRACLAAVRVRGHSAVVFVYHPTPERFSSEDLKLLIMLADQTGLVLSRAPAVATRPAALHASSSRPQSRSAR